jgi:hypothetical protein
MIVCFLSLILLIFWIMLIDVCMLKYPCIVIMKWAWSWCMIFLICCWVWYTNILLRIFAFMFI